MIVIRQWWQRLSRRERLVVSVFAAVGVAVVGWLVLDPFRWPARVAISIRAYQWPLGFTPDGQRFATSGWEGITLWDIATGRQTATWSNPDGPRASVGMFSPDGHRLVALVGSRRNAGALIQLLDAAAG